MLSRERRFFKCKELTADAKKSAFGNEWTFWGCGEKGRNLSQCRKTQKEDKDKILKHYSFSKKKLVVLNDSDVRGKHFALADEKVWFPYILYSRAFTTVVPKFWR